MSLTLSLPLVASAGAICVGTVLLAVGVMLAWRDAILRFGISPSHLKTVILPEITAVSERIETRLSSHERQRSSEMDALRQNIAQMRADVEWLAGERMIEQAIEMCRDGLSNERISADLGLQPDAIRTLKLLRVH